MISCKSIRFGEEIVGNGRDNDITVI
jgi:hypothetical protein